MPLIARDGPERSLTQTPTNETITFSNDVPLSGGPVFSWAPPHSVPVVKDPVISTPEKKAPIGITIRDSCEMQTKTVIMKTEECVKSTSKRQEDATTVPHVSQKQQGSPYKPANIRKVEISGKNRFQESSFDSSELNANKKLSDSEEATSRKYLGQKHTRMLCLSADDKRSGFKTQETLGLANFESKKSDHENHCIQPKEPPDAKDRKHDTVASPKESKIMSSSAETNRVEEDNPVSFLPLVLIINVWKLLNSRPYLVVFASRDDLNLRSHLTNGTPSI